MTSQNVTFDDALNSTSFAFQPANCTGSGWEVVKDRGYMGSYTSCTTTSGQEPSANVTFTGVAVYYTSAFLDGNSIRFKLDGNLSSNIDLSTPSGQAANTAATKIFWKATNLTNGVHSLQLLPGNGTSTLTVDALIITQVVSGTSNVSHTTAASGSSTGQSTSNSTSSTTKFSYGLGITFGVISFIIFCTILIALGRRRLELKRFTWSKPIPPLRPNTTSYFSQGEQTGTQDQYVSSLSVHSPKIEQSEQAPLPLRPLPFVSQNAGYPTPTIHEANQEAYDEFDTRTSGATARSWPSPAPSNRILLSPGSLSSRGHLENIPTAAAPSLSRSGTATSSSTNKLEPVRRVTIL